MEKKFDLKKFLSNNAIIILIILLALFVGCTTQNFFTETNGKNLLLNVAPRFIIACGVSGCLITKGTDLSAGRQVGLAACFSTMLLQSVDYSARMLPWLPDIPWPVALLIVMAIMACFGAINGCIIAFLKVPPFIATLGMQTIVYGLCSVITNNQPMGGYKQSYLTVASGTLGPIPFLAIFAQVKGNGDDDDKALCNVGVSGVDAEELQANLQDFKDQNTDQNAGDLADAAVGGNAADCTSRDRFQLIAQTEVDRSAAGLRR